jgi:hypothetical protein
MNCDVHVFYKMIFSDKFGFILETSFFLYMQLDKCFHKAFHTNENDIW